MTKRYFDAAAEIVRDMEYGELERQLVADMFILLFEQFAPNFDRERFLKACGL